MAGHSVPGRRGAPVIVQSMCTTLTADVNATLQQIAELTASGCQIVRVAVPSQDDADALPEIAQEVAASRSSPTSTSSRSTCSRRSRPAAPRVRVNPGNIKQFDDKVGEIARAAKDAGTRSASASTPARWTSGCWRSTARPRPEALVESALWECSLFEEHDFRDIKISVKHHDPVVMMQAYRQLAEQCDYPLHLGVTEAGPAFQGTIKSAVALRRPAGRGHRRHDPRLAVRAPGRGGQGRQSDPASRSTCASAGSEIVVLPVLRPGSGRRRTRWPSR